MIKIGQCVKCKQFLPSHVMFVTERGDGQICAYCKTDKNVITLEDDNGNAKKFTKDEMVNKYKEFMSNVVNRPEVRKKVFKEGKTIIT